MGMTGTRVQRSNTRVEHNTEPSREEVRREISRVQTVNQPETPGAFKRFINWVKNLFTKKSEPNLEQGVTEQGNMTAETRSDINNTLSPEITGEGVTGTETAHDSVPETESTESAELSKSTDTNGVELNEVPTGTVTREEIARRLESAVVSPSSETESETPDTDVSEEGTGDDLISEEEENTDKPETTGKVTVGDMVFDTYEVEGNIVSTSGTLNVLGKTTEWKTDERIVLVSRDGQKFSGSGTIKFDDKNLLYNGRAIVLINDNKINYFFDEGLYYNQDGIKIDLGVKADSLGTFAPKEISLLNFRAEDDSTMKGGVTIGGDGFKGYAERELVWFPDYLFKGIDAPKLRLEVGEDQKLNFSLFPSDNVVSVGIDNVAEITGVNPVTITVLEDGKITYHIPEDYSVNILNEFYTQNVKLSPIELTVGQGLSSLEIPGLELNYNGVALSGVTLKVSADKGNRGGSITAKKLTYKSLTVDDISGEIGESGISASAGGYSFKIGDKELSGSLGGLKWNPGKLFSVSNFEIGVDKIPFGDNISVESAKLQFSLNEGEFALSAEGTFNIDKLQSGWIGISTGELSVHFALTNEGGNFGLSASTEGGITFEIGNGETSIASVNAENISYDNGVFGLGALTLDTTFDKLVSDKFSGSAGIIASGLTFSGKNKTDFDITSINLDIKNLAYRDKTLVNSASVALIFKDDREEETAAVDGELAVGENSGILTGGKIAVYLTDSRKGVKLTADKFSPSCGYLKLDISNFSASFFNNSEYDDVKGDITLSSGDKLNEILGIGEFTLSASDFSINSRGIKIGTASASLKEMTLANSLKFENLDVELGFNDDMTLKSSEISGSAKLGNITLTNVSIGIGNDENQEAQFTAESIAYKEKNLEISEVDGKFSRQSVNVANAKFRFKIAETEVSGSLENLSWSSESDFSVEKFAVEVGEIAVNDDFSIKGAELEASLKNNNFKLGASAAFHIADIQKGIVRISGDDLTFALDLNEEKGEDGAALFKVGGFAEGTVTVEIGDIVNTKIGNIGYNDGIFSVGTFSADSDLNKLGGEKFGGQAEITVTDLKFQKGKTPTVGAMGLTVKSVSYNGKKLMDDLSVNVILSDEATGGQDNASARDATLALDDGVDGTLGGANVSVYLTDSFKGVKIDAESFSVTPGNFNFSFDSFSGEFGKGVCNMELGTASMQTDLAENKIAKAIGIENLNFTAENVSVNNNKFSVGKISASAKTDINIGGFRIKSAEISAGFDEGMKLRNFKLGGELGYKNYISGRASVTVDKEGGLSFEEVSDINVSYGCFRGSLESIEKNGETVKFKTLRLAKETEGDSNGESEFEGDKSSIIAKCLRGIPNIGVTINELTFENGVLKKPSMDDIIIDKFEKEFKLGDVIAAKIGYSGGDAGEFTVGVDSSFAMPKNGEEKKNYPFIKALVPIIPPILSADFELGFSVGIKAELKFAATAKRDDKKLDFDTNVKAKADGAFGFYGRAMLDVNAVIASLKGGLEISLNLPVNMMLEGNFGLVYDPDAETIFKSFKVNKEKTSMGFELNSDLNFNVKLIGELKGFPIIFKDKTLSHSWDLFSYKLMGVSIKGGITYDQEEERYRFNADPTITRAGGLDDYSPKKTQDAIDDFANSIDGLKGGMEEIDKLLGKAKGGVDLSKGSLDSIDGELGDKVQKEKQAHMPELKKRIDNVFQSSRKDSLKCHTMMVSLRKIIDKSAEKMVENERNVEQLEEVIRQSRTALDIVGYNAGDGDDGRMTKAKYRSFIKNLEQLKKDEAKIKQLASLEPAAVVNMFKAFKLRSSDSWADNHDATVKMTTQRQVQSELPDEYKSQIDTRIYDAAMGDLDKMLKNKENAIARQEALVEAAKNALDKAERTKKELEEKLAEFESRKKRVEQDRDQKLREEAEACKAKTDKRKETGDAALKAIEEGNAKDLKKAEEARNNAISKAQAQRREKVQAAEHSAAVGISRIKGSGEKKKAAIERINEQKNKIIAQLEKEEQASVEAANRAYEKVKNTANSKIRASKDQTAAAVEKIQAESEKVISKIKLDAESKLENLNEEELKARQDLEQAEQRLAAANLNHEESKETLELFKQQLGNTEDISTAMVGFQGFITTEHDSTANRVAALRKRYGVGGKSGEAPTDGDTAVSERVIDEDEMKRRTANVISIIQRLIDDATEENLKKNLGDGETGNDELLARHNSRLATIQKGNGIVDVNMKGFGLSGMNSVTSFNTMKADREKFQTIQNQFDTIYKQLSDFHTVMKQALERWNEVNGIDFKKARDTTEFINDSAQVVRLIDDVGQSEKKQINIANPDTLFKDVERLKGFGGSFQPNAETAAMNPDQIKKEQQLLGVG